MRTMKDDPDVTIVRLGDDFHDTVYKIWELLKAGLRVLEVRPDNESPGCMEALVELPEEDND